MPRVPPAGGICRGDVSSYVVKQQQIYHLQNTVRSLDQNSHPSGICQEVNTLDDEVAASRLMKVPGGRAGSRAGHAWYAWQ